MFVLKEFKQNEFATAYMGKNVDYTYMYGDIISIPNTWKNHGIQEEYWLGHRINHGSGKKKYIKIKGNMVMHATKKISIGDELFCDYTRDVFSLDATLKCNCTQWTELGTSSA